MKRLSTNANNVTAVSLPQACHRQIKCINGHKARAHGGRGTVTLEGRLVHAGHAGAVVLPGETVDVNFQRYGAYRRTEVKQTHLSEEKRGRGREREKDLMQAAGNMKPHLVVMQTVRHCH